MAKQFEWPGFGQAEVEDQGDAALLQEVQDIAMGMDIAPGWTKKHTPAWFQNNTPLTPKGLKEIAGDQWPAKKAAYQISKLDLVLGWPWAPLAMKGGKNRGYSEGLTEGAYKFLTRYLGFTSSANGKRIQLSRSSLSSRTWLACENYPEALMANAEVWAQMLERYDAYHEGDDVCYGFGFKKIGTGADAVHVKVKLFEALQIVVESKDFTQSDRFYLGELEPFTNDPRTPAYAFFPSDSIEANMKGTTEEPHCPAWLRFESQMSPWGIPVFRAFVRGIFDAKFVTRQALILRDTGQTGKSLMTRALTSIVPNGFYTQLPQALNNFSGSLLVGSRLVLMPDTGSNMFHKSTLFKNITGGDPILVEFKGQTPFKYQAAFTLLVTTNTYPAIDTSSRAEASRTLIVPLMAPAMDSTEEKDVTLLKTYCKLDENGDLVRDRDGKAISMGTGEFGDDLKSQVYDYLYLCGASYRELCPKHGEIPMPPEMFDYLKGACSTPDVRNVDGIMDKLEFGEGYRVSPIVMNELMEDDELEEMDQEMSKRFKDKVRTRLRDRGCKPIVSHGRRFWEGCRMRDESAALAKVKARKSKDMEEM
jgi:hypothetical protein